VDLANAKYHSKLKEIYKYPGVIFVGKIFKNQQIL